MSSSPFVPATGRRRSRVLVPGVVVLVLGLVLTAVGFTVAAVRAGGPFVDALSAPVRSVPWEGELTLAEGRNAVYVDTTGRLDDAVVVGPTGRVALDRSVTAEVTVARGSREYRVEAYLDVPADAEYAVRLDGQPSTGVFIAPAASSRLAAAAGWALLGGSGVVALLVGLVLTVTGAVRSRSRTATAGVGPAHAPTVPSGPPPGWYPDPSGAAPTRWWDGTRWTEHTAGTPQP